MFKVSGCFLRTALSGGGYPFCQSMEILSEIHFGSSEDFEPTFFIDVSEHIDSKIKIMQLYESELGKHPFPRSVEAIRALALLRGVQANCHSAEAFRIIRWLDVERANEY